MSKESASTIPQRGIVYNLISRRQPLRMEHHAVQLDPESEFYRDIQEMGITYILLNLTFPENLPFSPPFMRVISPPHRKRIRHGGRCHLHGTVDPARLGLRLHGGSHHHAVCRQFDKGTEQNLPEVQNRKGIQQETGRSFLHEKYRWVTPPLADG
ncbi:ubiquitin-conjugating enzyme E2Q-like protein 1 [Centruroides vittatus]|uniref:ubiquitin-conjugating enzyme E2Q-like protein 1 n=1 Tax=Centruroides vittatus TaxID=120091 RepID=UPI00350F9B4E